MYRLLLLAALPWLLLGCGERPRSAFSTEDFNYLPAPNGNQIIQHTYFTLSYSEPHEQAEWVAYELTPHEVSVNVEREGNFRKDPLVTTGSATLEDYRRSGFDRGHLAPVGDLNFNQEAMEESFYLSNISPQRRAFNGGIWSSLENRVRSWAAEKDGIFVVTGPVLGGPVEESIGPEQVTVPKYFYKVLLSLQGDQSEMIGFVLPNQKSQQDLRAFVEKVDNIEAYTGLDFFPALPDDLEERLEGEVAADGWFE